MSTRRVLRITLILGTLAAAGCGSTSTASTAPTSVVPQPSATTTLASTIGPPLPSNGQAFVVGLVPAVTGATDLSKQPQVAAGAPPAPTALTGKDLVIGTGDPAGSSATVRVQYVGALYDTGIVFDASWTDSGPASFSLSGVVPGFKDAIVGMRVGGRREIVIPPALGYGVAGYPPTIPSNATLVFVIDLLGVS
jgi:peptidylprolyl isomerase